MSESYSHYHYYCHYEPSEAQACPVLQEQTPYQHVEIRHHPVYGHQLLIDGDLQISETDSLYGAAMIAPLQSCRPLTHVAILGGGDGGVLQALLDWTAHWHLAPTIEMLDIDARIMELCQQYMPRLCGPAFTSDRASVRAEDAFAYIAQARNLDGVIYDLTMEPVGAEQDRFAFIQQTLGHIARSLRPHGVLSMQCCGEGMGDTKQNQAESALLQEIDSVCRQNFEQIVYHHALIPSYHEGWTFLSAVRKARQSAALP